MTQQELDALKALANAATPGPWTASPRSTDGRVDGLLGAEINELEQPERGQFTSLADAAFIAASREAVPALLDALAAANARITALEAQLAAVPVEALLNYFDHMWACSYPGAFRDMKAISAWVDAKRQEVQP